MLCVQGLGYAVSLAGFFWYNYIKLQKGTPSSATPTPPRRSDYTIVSERDPGAQKGEV